MSEMMNQARLDYHIIVLTKLVKGAVTLLDVPDGSDFVCGTCQRQHAEWNKVYHLDNCPVGDLQRLIDGATPPEITERNYRLANERLNQILDNIHELVKSDPADHKIKPLTNVEIIETVRHITGAVVEDQKRRKTDG